MFVIDKKNYELKYNMKRVELIENAVGMPTMADIAAHRGMLSLSTLKAYIAYGLKEEGSDVFVKPKEGLEMAEKLIESMGYQPVDAEVIEALHRDCPFFFQGA